VDAVGDRTYHTWPSPDRAHRPGAHPLGPVGEAFASACAGCSACSRPVECLRTSGSPDDDQPTFVGPDNGSADSGGDSRSTDSSSTDSSSTDRSNIDGGEFFCDDDGARPDSATLAGS